MHTHKCTQLYNAINIFLILLQAWKAWFDEETPEEALIPDGYSGTLDSWHKLLLIRAWCPDRAIPMARIYVAETMGPQVKFCLKYVEIKITFLSYYYFKTKNL